MQRTERSEQSPLPEIEKQNPEKCRETASIQIIHRSRNRPSVQVPPARSLACSYWPRAPVRPTTLRGVSRSARKRPHAIVHTYDNGGVPDERWSSPRRYR